MDYVVSCNNLAGILITILHACAITTFDLYCKMLKITFNFHLAAGKHIMQLSCKSIVITFNGTMYILVGRYVWLTDCTYEELGMVYRMALVHYLLVTTIYMSCNCQLYHNFLLHMHKCFNYQSIEIMQIHSLHEVILARTYLRWLLSLSMHIEKYLEGCSKTQCRYI